MGSETAGKLLPVPWSEVGTTFYLRRWTSLVKVNANALLGTTPEHLPSVAADMKKFCCRFDVPATEEYRIALASAVLGAAVALLLVQQGWKPCAVPGEAVVLQRGKDQLWPLNIVASLKSGELSADIWQHQCSALGIQGMDLGKATKPATQVLPRPAG